MEKREELKQVYDIFIAAWRIYKTYYPPNDLQDDDYWSKLAGALKKAEAEYNCPLCRDIFCNVAADLERKAKARYQQEAAQASRKMGENL